MRRSQARSFALRFPILVLRFGVCPEPLMAGALAARAPLCSATAAIHRWAKKKPPLLGGLADEVVNETPFVVYLCQDWHQVVVQTERYHLLGAPRAVLAGFPYRSRALPLFLLFHLNNLENLQKLLL